MAKTPRWTAGTKLLSVQLEWEDEPTARPVRLGRPVPRKGQSARVGMGGSVEVECVIVRVARGVLYVQLAKPQDAEDSRVASAS